MTYLPLINMIYKDIDEQKIIIEISLFEIVKKHSPILKDNFSNN